MEEREISAEIGNEKGQFVLGVSGKLAQNPSGPSSESAALEELVFSAVHPVSLLIGVPSRRHAELGIFSFCDDQSVYRFTHRLHEN